MADPGRAAHAGVRRVVRAPVVDRVLGMAADGLRRSTGARRRRLAIITYHRVDHPAARPDLFPGLVSATPEVFERQLTHLAHRHRIVSLEELLALRGGASAPRGTLLAITFDDGYRDMGENAWPVLRRLGLPATLFVPTAMIDRPVGFWWDRVWAAIRSVPTGRTVTTPLGVVRIDAEPDRLAIFRSWRSTLKQLPQRDLQATVEATCNALGGGPATSALLTWDELRTLAAEGLAIAPHTRTHPLLTRIEPDALPDELAGSRAELARELGGAPPVIAYPSGAHDPAVVRATAAAGYEIAVTTDRGTDDLAAPDWLRLHRINVGGASTQALLDLQLAWPLAARQVRGSGSP